MLSYLSVLKVFQYSATMISPSQPTSAAIVRLKLTTICFSFKIWISEGMTWSFVYPLLSWMTLENYTMSLLSLSNQLHNVRCVRFKRKRKTIFVLSSRQLLDWISGKAVIISTNIPYICNVHKMSFSVICNRNDVIFVIKIFASVFRISLVNECKFNFTDYNCNVNNIRGEKCKNATPLVPISCDCPHQQCRQTVLIR